MESRSSTRRPQHRTNHVLGLVFGRKIIKKSALFLTAAANVAVTMETMNAMDLTEIVKKELEDAASAELDKEKRGTLAVTDNTIVKQDFKVNDTTVKNINSVLEQHLKNYTEENVSFGQTMRYMVVYQPCGNLTISQTSVANMIATDLARAVSDVVMQSEDVKKFVTTKQRIFGGGVVQTFFDSTTAVDKQKSTDTVVAGFDAISGIVKSITGSWVVVLLAIPVLLLVLFFVFKGGSSSKSSSESSSPMDVGEFFPRKSRLLRKGRR